MIFLARFWDDADEPMRRRLVRAVESGQLELTTGGWVMPDEACPTFPAMLDNLFEGHQWISSHFNSVCILQHLTFEMPFDIRAFIDRRSIMISMAA